MPEEGTASWGTGTCRDVYTPGTASPTPPQTLVNLTVLQSDFVNTGSKSPRLSVGTFLTLEWKTKYKQCDSLLGAKIVRAQDQRTQLLSDASTIVALPHLLSEIPRKLLGLS